MITWFHTHAKAKSEAYKFSTCKTKLKNDFKLLYDITSLKCYYIHVYISLKASEFPTWTNNRLLVQKSEEGTWVYHLYPLPHPIQWNDRKEAQKGIHSWKWGAALVLKKCWQISMEKQSQMTSARSQNQRRETRLRDGSNQLIWNPGAQLKGGLQNRFCVSHLLSIPFRILLSLIQNNHLQLIFSLAPVQNKVSLQMLKSQLILLNTNPWFYLQT